MTNSHKKGVNSNDRLEIKLCLRIVTVFLQKKKFRMKKLTLIRHAKSSWSDYGLRDHDRPLADRGLRDAPFMAQLMASRGWLPDALVSSTALRARTTAEFFAAALGWQPAVVQLDKRIYEASVPPPGFYCAPARPMEPHCSFWAQSYFYPGGQPVLPKKIHRQPPDLWHC